MKTSRMWRKKCADARGCLTALAVLFVWLTTASFAGAQYLITNNNAPNNLNEASIFSVGSDGSLTLVKTVPTLGSSQGSGKEGRSFVYVLRSKTKDCVYIGDNWGKYNGIPGDVAAIDMSTQTLVGRFPGFLLDSGTNRGTGLAGTPDGTYLFAAFTESDTITTYKLQQGCTLKRISQIITVGARNSFNGVEVGSVLGMKVTPNGKFLILTYDDGSFGSYKIDPNTGGLRLISRYLVADGGIVSGIDITSDSRWGVFGVDTGSGAGVEIAAIHEDGSLAPTLGYSGIGTGSSSNNVWLSPDETILYVGNTVSGQITAVPFNRTTGVVSVGEACTSPVLTNINGALYFLTGLTGSSSSPTGSPLYATTKNAPAAIVIANFQRPCTWTESPNSPVILPESNSSYLFGVGLDPPRSF